MIGCDYYSAYRRYMREFDVVVQFCLAHLIRDVKFLTTLPDARDQAVRDEVARGVARTVWGDPPPRRADGPAVPKPA